MLWPVLAWTLALASGGRTNNVRLTTKKITASRYAVVADGRITGLYISKGQPAQYRCPQEWDVCRIKGDDYLFSCKGLHACMTAIRKIISEISVAPVDGLEHNA
jgi:hypothetical protein